VPTTSDWQTHAVMGIFNNFDIPLLSPCRIKIRETQLYIILFFSIIYHQFDKYIV